MRSTVMNLQQQVIERRQMFATILIDVQHVGPCWFMVRALTVHDASLCWPRGWRTCVVMFAKFRLELAVDMRGNARSDSTKKRYFVLPYLQGRIIKGG